jgi:pyruvate dehydrogenase E1 component
VSSLPRDQQAPQDVDPQESLEWLESLDAVVAGSGHARARFLMDLVLEHARSHGVAPTLPLTTDFVNTIAPEDEARFPGDEWMEKRIRRIVRWNAMAMVTRANQRFEGIGGHISTYASAATLYEVGFNHFFRGREDESGGDHVYFQGHASPGIYARAFLEGRLTQDQLDRFRREAERGQGLSSYPHPRLMPDLWEFPTVSMGLGPLNAIYQARFLRYLQARGICDTSRQRVWAFCGDGEMDEPESFAGLSIASRERLDNLTVVVNCNLQRLDGPVRGNGKIVQELEALFRGAGWNVVKVIWGRAWDPLFQADGEGLLRDRCNEVPDGQFQKYTVSPGDFIRKDFFGAHPRLLELVAHLSDDQLRQLRRGGHDYRKVYAAFSQAVRHEGRPTCILAHTVKGWTLGEGFEARNTTHQMKKLKLKELLAFRDLLQLPIADAAVAEAPFYHPGPDSEEVQYLTERRRALGGFVPRRRTRPLVSVPAPPSDVFAEFLEGTKTGDGVSTTMAFVRLLAKLLRDERIGNRIVPIIPDEARTFGMDPLFRQVGIYSSLGQLYEPVDKNLLLYYRETKDGQVLEEGINEAGSMASFTAAGTSYSTQGQPMVPFYTFYSMFGFQRVGDLIWAFGDSRGRGFLLGATAGRTTLNGEGLQHEDGHSHLVAAAMPSCRAYDPAFAYETAVIVEDGLKRMLDEEQDLLYYITLQNENYPMPPMPEGVRDGILAGLYPFRLAARRPKQGALHVNLLGSGSIMGCVLAARDMLAERFGVSADVWAAPSYPQLRRDCLAVERWNRLHPTETPRTSHLARTLAEATGPFVAASDWVTALPELVARWMPRPFVTLGTDGYGMSDTRPVLRRHFEVDAESIVIAAFDALRQAGQVDGARVAEVIAALDYDPAKPSALEI